MGSGFGFRQFEDGPAADHIFPVLDEADERFAQIQDLGLIVHDRQQDDAEAGLHRSHLVQVVQNNLRRLVLFQLDDNAHAFAVGFVAKIGNALDFFVPNQLGDALDQLGLVDLIGNFRHNDRFPVAGHFLDRRPGAHDDDSAAAFVGGPDSAAPVNKSCGREIRAGNQRHDLVQR